MTLQVAVAACRRTATSPPDDLYPDDDAAPLLAALSSLGATGRMVAWDDPTLDWSSFDRVLVSSTWDSVDHPASYLQWAGSVGTTLINPAPVLRWGLDKRHQIDLSAVVEIIPTEWVGPGSAFEPPDFEFVVKPAISAGGRSTVRYPAGADASRPHVASLQAAGQTVMVQPYLASIDVDGEADLIYIGGSFSHAVGKLPGLPEGRGIIDSPWEQMAWSGPLVPTGEQLAAGAAIVDAIEALAGAPAAYARVDLLAGPAGSPVLLEVEVIDPILSLDTHPEAAARLAAVVVGA